MATVSVKLILRPPRHMVCQETDGLASSFLSIGAAWNFGYGPFAAFEEDTIIAVSPTENVIHTCDPEVSSQIFRSHDFRKPPKLIALLNVFGPGLTGSEGPEGRLYRRVTAPFFTDQTNERVWRTSIESVTKLMESVLEHQDSKLAPQASFHLRSVVADMTLYNVFTTCFEKFPGQRSLQSREDVAIGQERGFRQAITLSVDYIAQISLMPKVVLRMHIPFLISPELC